MWNGKIHIQVTLFSWLSHVFKQNLILYFLQIVWDNQFLGDCGNKALVTLDGTDMPVQMKFYESLHPIISRVMDLNTKLEDIL